MKTKFWITFTALALVISFSVGAEAKTKRYHYTGPTQAGDVEYNATEKSPTLPLVQSAPPQNYTTSVQVGVPSYYYYYPTNYYGMGSGYYGNVPQAGVGFYNVNGRTTRTFWATTPIPGQVAPPGAYNNSFGSGFGGYGPGNYPPYIGNTLFVP